MSRKTSITKPWFFSTLFFFLILTFLVANSSTQNTTSKHKSHTKKCSLKSSSAHQCPPDFPSYAKKDLKFIDIRLKLVYPIIQKFKSIITSDPLNITKTWVGSDICSYKGFYCDNPPYNSSTIALASIDFNGFHLAASSLDGFLDQLPDIALFHANSNSFSGAISPKIANLAYLYELDISNNLFSGQFPSAVLGMKGLSFLDLRFNFFTGSIPPQIFTQELDALFLNNNNFMQNLPDINLGLSHIILLTLANNNFNGPIPTSISKSLSSLTEVSLFNNRLTGCLPFELGLLKNAVVLDASNNELTGPLPFSLSCLDKVEQLSFASNLLFGFVPEVICDQLINLVDFSLSDNYFMHVGPICEGLIQRGVLDVSNNCILGLPFQRSIEECAYFFSQPRFCNRMGFYDYIPCGKFAYRTSFAHQVKHTP